MTRDERLRPKDVEAEYGYKQSTLATWRATGTGPAWFPMGRRMVGYTRAAIEAWERQCAAERGSAA